MKFIGIIPARYASTRFPGKPLAEIGGKTVIRRVYEQANKALDTIVVATDDERIYDDVESFSGKVVMTRPDHKCGTDRCLEAYEAITTPNWREQNDTDTVIINIQGDEPFIQPEQIEALDEAAALESIAHMPARVKCATLGWKTMQKMLKGEAGSASTENED